MRGDGSIAAAVPLAPAAGGTGGSRL